MVVTVVVTSLLCLSAAAPISVLGLKACSLCKANKPLQSLEPVLGTQVRKWWLLPCCCHHCRQLTCSGRVVLPLLCPLFPGYLLQFSPVLESQAAPFLPKSCPAHACCLAGLAAHVGGRGKGLRVLLLGRDIGFCPGKAEGDGFRRGREGSPTASLMVERV